MSRNKLMKITKKMTAVILSAAMVITMLPLYTAGAADNDEPYVVSAGRATYSSSDAGNNTSDKAVDGNLSTRWESVQGVDLQWLYVDLGKETEITSIFLKWEDAYAKSYAIQFSNDEETWEDVYIKGNGSTGGNQDESDISISYTMSDGNVNANWTSIDNAKYKVCINSDDNVAIAPDGYKFTGHGVNNGLIKLDPGTYKLIVIALNSSTGAEITRGEREIVVPNAGETLPQETEAETEAGSDPLAHTINVSGTARYVRVYMTERATNYGYSLYEFQVYGRNGLTPRPDAYGENLALNKTTQRSAIRDVWWMYGDDGELDPDKVTQVESYNAVDGDESTSFTSLEEDNQWIYVDLGQSYEIGRIILKWAESGGKIYDVDVSNDAKTWTTVYRRINGYADLEDNIPVYVQSARYVRVYGYSRVNKNGDGFKLNELEVYKYISGDKKVTYTLSELPQTQIIDTANGSYVSNDMYLTMTKTPAYIDEENVSTPIDSNDWWQSAMIKKFGCVMSTLPFKTQYSKKGLSILTATEGWLPTPGETDVNLSVVSEETPDLYILPENFEPADSYDRVHGYSDYTVDLQLCDTNGVAMTSTHVKGSPYIYCEFGDRQAFYLTVPNLTSFFDDNGNAILTESGTSITTDHIGVHVTDNDNKAKEKNANSYYCITLPAGTVVRNNGGKLKFTFPGTDRYASVGTMQSKGELNTFYQHGYAFVTDTNVSYSYSENLSKITSNYDVTTTLKRKGFSDQTMQLMLPHQWKNSPQEANKVSTYTSVRGDLHGIWSNKFQTVDTFEGLLPTFAMPSDDSFDQEKVLEYLYVLENATTNLTPAADAYWEGKNLHPLGMGALMADQLGETELRDVFLARLKKILVNWFTYDGTDDVSFFIYDTSWGTLYYKASEFGANWGICDHHFTYGYFMFGAAVLATYDKEFYNDYKDMIEMLMRDYANPSDTDTEYCRFRAYDLYEGHSWAGGYADNEGGNGNNQESASESLFSWVAMYLWGVLSEDDTYRDAGIFGFTNEMEAIKQYWFDYDGDNWVEDWPYEVVAQVYGGGNFYGTFFGGQPLYCYGIQWLPVSEYLMYYGMNQTRAAEIYQGLLDDTEDAMVKAEIAARKEGKSEEEIQKTLKDYPQADNGWQHITWTFLAQTNPSLALEKFNENADKVQRTDQANTYWFIHAMKEYGYKTDEIIATGDLSATVYYNEGTDKYTANVWNPCDVSKTVTFVNASGATLGTANVGAKSLVSFEVEKNGGFAYTQAQTPTFTTTALAGGNVVENASGTVTYDDTQLVEINSADAGTTIYYTTDGSIPTTSSNVYTGAILVSSTSTLKAIAVKDGYINSTFASLNITINGDNVQGDENLALGKSVTASSLQGADAGYAASNLTDGKSSTRWASQAGSDDEWIYVDLGGIYAVNTVVLNWEAAYATEYEIQVSKDGNSWTTVSTVSTGAQGEKTISFAAVNARYVKMQGVSRVNEGYGYSLYEMEVYGAVQAAAPTITPASGSYDTAQTITMSTTVKGAEIKYTLDGSEPTLDSPSYIAPFTADKSVVVKAVTYRKGMMLSKETVSSIIIKGTVALSASEMVVAVGNSKKLNAITDGTVTWSSSNNSVATVDGNGNVSGVSVGTATITAKVGNNTATCIVAVKEAVKLQSVTLSSTAVTMKVKTSDILTATLYPANTTDDTTLTWTSSDSSVVSVNNGEITAKKEGTATITVTCSGISATCTVTVEPKYTTAEKLVNSEYNVMLNNVTLHQGGRFEGSLKNLVDGVGFGSTAGGNWASQTMNGNHGDAFIIIDLSNGYTLNQIDAMYIQWKDYIDKCTPNDGFRIMVANDSNYNITESGTGDDRIVTQDNSNWTTVFNSVSDNALNAVNGVDWAASEVGCLSILPFKNDSYTGTFNHIKIAFDYTGSMRDWGVQAYEIALLINDEEQGGETPSEQVTTEQTETEKQTETAKQEETTTQMPTTEEVTEPDVEQPVVPFGVEVNGLENNSFTVVMGNPGNGQTYNVYVDGVLIQNVALGSHTITGIAAGTHTVKVTGVLNGIESAGTEIQVTVGGTAEIPTEMPSEDVTEEQTEKPTTSVETKAGVEIIGFQISTARGGSRTVYAVEPEINGKEVVERGLVYGLAARADESEMYIGADSQYVKAFAATAAGEMDAQLSESSTAKSYAMTMVQNIGSITVAGLEAEYYVRVYAKLSDGTYVYSDVQSFSLYSVADVLYSGNLMNTQESHDYLYNNILSVVKKDYPTVDFQWSNTLVK